MTLTYLRDIPNPALAIASNRREGTVITITFDLTVFK